MQTIIIKTHQDAIAAVPHLLGFHPTGAGSERPPQRLGRERRIKWFWAKRGEGGECRKIVPYYRYPAKPSNVAKRQAPVVVEEPPRPVIGISGRGGGVDS